MGYFWAEVGFDNCFGVYSFSLFLAILTFDFDLILGSFLKFWGPNGLFWGLGWGSKSVLGSTHVVFQVSFCMFPSILVMDFT